jgi:hypothetical protein
MSQRGRATGRRLPATVTASRDGRESWDGRDGAASRPGADGAAVPAPGAYGQALIGQLLTDSVNQLLSVGLQLASVRCRLPGPDEQVLLENLTDQLDAALVDIRRLSVSVALRTGPAGQESAGRPRS